VTSGAATVGHRFHHPGIITIGSANDYVEKLRACHVIVDPAERRRIIADGAVAVAQPAGLSLVEDEGLLAENAGLTEWPVPLLGGFDPAFLQVPPEVIQLTMRTNQKYFAVTGADGALAPNFICTANIEASDGGEAIVRGNQKVLAARLSDAKFFWEQDLKVPLEAQAKSSARSSSTKSSAPSPTRSSASRSWRDGWSKRVSYNPPRDGEGDRRSRWRGLLIWQSRRRTPSTILRMVPLPVPGRI
jgi:glycyl-tRNA synthetase beta chain